MKKLLLFSLVLVILSSCTKSAEENNGDHFPVGLINLTQEEFFSLYYDSFREIEPEEAIYIAEGFLTALREDEANYHSTRTDVHTSSFSVIDKSFFTRNGFTSTRSMEEYELPVYEISVSSSDLEGRIYICADERHAEVLSYIPEATDDYDTLEKTAKLTP